MQDATLLTQRLSWPPPKLVPLLCSQESADTFHTCGSVITPLDLCIAQHFTSPNGITKLLLW